MKNLKLFHLYVVLSVLLALFIGSGSFLYSQFNKVAEQEKWANHSAQIIYQLELALSALKDAETGVRGYLIVGTSDYLEPYRQGVVEAYQHLNEFKALTQENPKHQLAAATLKDLMDKRFAVLRSLLNRVNNQEVDRKRRLDAMADGFITMNTLRELIGKMKDDEASLLEERRVATEKRRTSFQVLLIFTTFLSIFIVAVAFRLFWRQHMTAQREAHEQSKLMWVRERLAGVAQRLSGDIPLEAAGKGLLDIFAEHLKVLGAKLFVTTGGRLQPVASYGVEHQYEEHEHSLVNEALEREDVWVVQDIPKSFWRISSSLGNAQPQSLVMMPFKFQGRPLGVIEMASFEPPNEMHREFLSKAAEMIGIGMHAVLSRNALQELLEKTQSQAEELQAQHEELQTQQEELRSNNEELEQQTRAMESQQQALTIKNQELEMIRHELERKAEALLRSSQYKSEFLAKMSHELRTPLNGLLILSTLLVENKEKNLTEQQKQFAKSIQSAGNDLLFLINDILDLSKIEARKLAIRSEIFSVQDLFTQLQQNFEIQAKNKNLEFHAKANEKARSTVMKTDRMRLEQILRNFLSNAIKFTERGEVVLEANLVGNGRIQFKVIDTGIGIPLEKQALVFEAFEQVDSSVSRKYGGTGLGLTIARELASLLQGEVSLRSELGTGSTFFVEIPIEVEEGAVTPAIEKKTSRDPSPEGQRNVEDETQARQILEGIKKDRKTIMIIEDDAKFVAPVTEVCRSYGFEPLIAPTAEIALAVLEHHTPDAILLDVKLPGVSGLGLLEMIKRVSHLRHVPVHIISALDYQHNALRMGALGYLTKPVTLDKIRSVMTRIEGVIRDHVRKVLVIEDDEKQGFAISQLIAGSDVEVMIARTGKEAIERLKTDTLDCVILDLSLPDISGFDFLAQLNSLETSLPPIVIYTAKELTSEEENYLRRYSESIIIKGARSPERLLDEVNLFLHRVESMLPQEKRNMLTQLRSHEKNFENKTVLLVDDDLRNLFALTSALEAKNLNVKIAKDGVEALEVLQQHDDIDLILMDIMMPRMDGLEAMRRIRASSDSRLKSLPIIALTAKAMREDHERCIEAGASDYLPKPVNLEHLLTSLKVWLTPKELFS